jgi:hypothetical protein
MWIIKKQKKVALWNKSRFENKILKSEQGTTRKYMSHDDKRGFQHKIIIYDTSLNTGLANKTKESRPVGSWLHAPIYET